MANSCKSIAVLAGQPQEVALLAFDYGRHLVCCCEYESFCQDWFQSNMLLSGFLTWAPLWMARYLLLDYLGFGCETWVLFASYVKDHNYLAWEILEICVCCFWLYDSLDISFGTIPAYPLYFYNLWTTLKLIPINFGTKSAWWLTIGWWCRAWHISWWMMLLISQAPRKLWGSLHFLILARSVTVFPYSRCRRMTKFVSGLVLSRASWMWLLLLFLIVSIFGFWV